MSCQQALQRHIGQSPVPGWLLCWKAKPFSQGSWNCSWAISSPNDCISLSVKSFLGFIKGYEHLEKEKHLFPQVRGKHARAFSSNINWTRRGSRTWQRLLGKANRLGEKRMIGRDRSRGWWGRERKRPQDRLPQEGSRAAKISVSSRSSPRAWPGSASHPLEASLPGELRDKTPSPPNILLGGFPGIPLIMEAQGLEWNPWRFLHRSSQWGRMEVT